MEGLPPLQTLMCWNHVHFKQAEWQIVHEVEKGNCGGGAGSQFRAMLSCGKNCSLRSISNSILSINKLSSRDKTPTEIFHIYWYANTIFYIAGKNPVCSHARAIHLFENTILPQCIFKAYRCKDYSLFRKGRCKSCVKQSCVYMGYDLCKYASGKYYLATKSRQPFCYSQ